MSTAKLGPDFPCRGDPWKERVAVRPCSRSGARRIFWRRLWHCLVSWVVQHREQGIAVLGPIVAHLVLEAVVKDNSMAVAKPVVAHPAVAGADRHTGRAADGELEMETAIGGARVRQDMGSRSETEDGRNRIGAAGARSFVVTAEISDTSAPAQSRADGWD